MTAETLAKTPLHALHLELGAKMVPFAGYDMPVQYPAGVLKEHLHTREQAGLFDVSHMGQIRLAGADAALGAGKPGAGGHPRPAGGPAALRIVSPTSRAGSSTT
ncbi:glycine cleavage system T protein [Pseudomonas aeruginosa]|nr:glycine cleavage system T protein [Pseudomonas aeruginosa]